ncbi:SMI1/KNR4 family protein [Catellatospora coxensis]|nr:SMI1/KNR4 family protein [Catellatospora coxensis]
MRRLRRRSVCAIDPGLTDAEFDEIEQEFGFRFADDHRAFLAAGLPVNTRPEPREPGVFYAHAEPWPDWRRADRDQLRTALNWPIEGVLFDVEHNGFWHESWDPRPRDTVEAVATAARMLAQVPAMVPVYGHRYLPAGRGLSGHPVLSMWQTDIIYYGMDLVDYIDSEFGRQGHGEEPWEPQATVEFWRDLV